MRLLQALRNDSSTKADSIDFSTSLPVQDGWDNDHQPKWKDRDLSGMDRKQVLDEYNKDTQLRCPSCNRADNQ